MNNYRTNKNVFIYANTCTRRRLDAKKFRKYFVLNEFIIVNNPKDADYIIFVTCGCLNNIVDRSIKLVNIFKNYDAELIVAGCLPDIAQEKLSNVFEGKIITTKKTEGIDSFFSENKIKFSEIDDSHILWRNFNPFGVNYEAISIIKEFLGISIINKIYSFVCFWVLY